MNAVELTEKLLIEAGGWQAIKHARALCEMGKVRGANYTPPLLKGFVSEGDIEFRAGLKISGRNNIENICSCRASRGWGTVCAHSLAVGLAVIRPKMELAAAALVAPVAPKLQSGPQFSPTATGELLKLHVILAPNFLAASEKNAITVGAEVDRDGQRVLVHALDAKKVHRCSMEDCSVIEKFRALNGGDLSGMMILTREKCVELLEILQTHPRVTLGKTTPADVANLLHTLRPITAGESAPVVSTEAPLQLATPQFSMTIEGSLKHLAARLQAIYDKRIVTIGITPAADAFSFADPADPQRRLARNLHAETTAFARLSRAGFTGPDASGHYVLRNEHAILNFFARELPQLQTMWDVAVGSRFTNITEPIQKISPRIEIQSSGENWFDLTVSLDSPGGDTFSSAEIQRLLQTGTNYLRLKNDKLAVFDSAMLDELQSVLFDCQAEQKQPGVHRVGKMHAAYLDAAIGESARINAPPAWQSWTRSQRQIDKPTPVPLEALEEVMRPYQKEGVYWMHFLARNGFCGILADEMGLGKTVQALAFIKTTGSPALVVCPSSLLHNWRREAERFAPELKVLVIDGSKRGTLFDQIPDSNLVITSYPLLRQDIERYRSLEFQTIILDEAQHIKNPETQNAQSAFALKAKHRFVLTGTPMENSVRDLWSIMNFLMPGYLGSRADFRDRYEMPISRGDAPDAQRRLSQRLRPFLLRRLKKNVAKELPEKLEQVAYCELSNDQTTIYKGIMDESKRQLHDLAGEKDAKKHRMMMLTALLRLRQVCCDPRLLAIEGTHESSKLNLLDELVREAIDGGHRMLIFSQFVSMLQLIKAHLESADIEFCYLDGATKHRQAEVDRFQNGTMPVFLISLKAGGVGLNLTGADTVIHYDPWWNPAVEAQATDRAHRIGQDKIVTIYKLIARNTVEEKILNLQLKKRAQIDATVESEEPLMSGLTMGEIESLLT